MNLYALSASWDIDRGCRIEICGIFYLLGNAVNMSFQPVDSYSTNYTKKTVNYAKIIF